MIPTKWEEKSPSFRGEGGGKGEGGREGQWEGLREGCNNAYASNDV